MEDIRFFKLTGYNSVIDFSADARFIIIGSYDGSFKVFDTANNKIYCKTKLKGPKRDIDIRHIGISFDNKYAAFSALGKVFLMNIEQKAIVWEYEYSRAERVMTTPFCFFNQSLRLLIPDGDCLLIYDIENRDLHNIILPDGAGFTDCIAVNPSNTRIAYKSLNDSWDIRLDRKGNVTSYSNEYKEDMSDRIFIYDTASGQLQKTIHVPYPPQKSYSKYMKFVDNETLLIQRQAFGLSYFDVNTKIEKLTRKWEEILGFNPSSYLMRNIKISDDGRYLFFNKEIPNSKQWLDDLEYILLDMAENKILFRKKMRENPAVFHFSTKQFAYIKHERDENYYRTDYLCIGEIQ